jgi:hypothetical protein
MNLYDHGSTHVLGPGPANGYQKVNLIADSNNPVTVPKAERKSYFAISESIRRLPGPGRYNTKRIFDNKQVVDYSKRKPSVSPPKKQIVTVELSIP